MICMAGGGGCMSLTCHTVLESTLFLGCILTSGIAKEENNASGMSSTASEAHVPNQNRSGFSRSSNGFFLLLLD